MPRIVREADVRWEGTLSRGEGGLSAATTGTFTDMPFSLPSRIAVAAGKTSPEELLAAAHGGCFTMSLAGELGRAGWTVERLDVRCTITMDEVEGKGHEIVHSAIAATAVADGLDEGALADVARIADEECPFSHLLKAAGVGVEITTTLGGS